MYPILKGTELIENYRPKRILRSQGQVKCLSCADKRPVSSDLGETSKSTTESHKLLQGDVGELFL